MTEDELRAVVNDLIIDWHPASQAAVVTLATAEQLPAEIKQYAAQMDTPLNTIGVFGHKGNSSESRSPTPSMSADHISRVEMSE